MIQLPEDRTPPMTPQLALRVAIVGSLALAMFAIIFFRLWYLQVLSSTQYAAAAKVNYVRDIPVAAPRGAILDAAGNVIAGSAPANVVQIQPGSLPVPVTLANRLSCKLPIAVRGTACQPGQDLPLYRRLARVLQVSNRPEKCTTFTIPQPGSVQTIVERVPAIECAIAQQVGLVPFAPVTVATAVPNAVNYYLAERQSAFPGVSVVQRTLRQYPDGTLAAQTLGTVGPISAQELGWTRFKGVSPQSIVGQSGLEATYDWALRGRDGVERVKVDSSGQFQGYLAGIEPIAGDNLRTSLNVALQRAGEAALAHSIALNYPASGGAFVALNPDNGQVYAMGSYPTFAPSVFTHPISTAAYDALTSPTSNFPLLNRAINSAGPTGSTFKPITATAALQSGVWTPTATFNDTGTFNDGTIKRHNAGGAAYGTLNIEQALQVSSDVFFYNLGALLNADPFKHPRGGALQRWARMFGIGRPTGIDLAGESTGTLPTPAWRAHQNALEAQCLARQGQFKHYPKGRPCQIAIVPAEPWTIGDNINMAVGQGDVQVTPLQLAVAYAVFANGGFVVHPHLGLDIQSPDGTQVQPLAVPSPSRIPISQSTIDVVRAGLRAAASQPGGTSFPVFGNFPLPVFGKTGTAQYVGQQDYSWYACFVPAPYTKYPILIVVTIERGGFGAVAAAPVARQMLSQWFFGRPGPWVAGTSKTL